MIMTIVTTVLIGCKKSDGEFVWNPSIDITVVSREDGSGTRGAFIELFGVEEKNESGEKIDMTTVEAQITNSTAVTMTTVAGDEYAIGYLSMGSVNDSVKVVKIDGVEATPDNIKSGDYKVSRPFSIVTKDNMENKAAADFINFILSSSGQTIVAETGYITLDNVKSFESTMAAGKVIVGGSSSVAPIMEKLAEAFETRNTNAEVELQVTDSTTGVTSTVEGAYDIGILSRALSEEEELMGLTAKMIAMDGIAVAVNWKNPMDNLTTEQVRKIYTGDVYTWGEVVK